MSAASNAVKQPMPAMVSAASGVTITKLTRTSMYTPAATIVAAWMSAETGVGPSIASGSQTWSGNWADLPTAPMKRHSAATVMIPGLFFSTSANGPPVTKASRRLSMFRSPLFRPKRIKIPIMKPKSPIRFVRKAFLQASAALAF